MERDSLRMERGGLRLKTTAIGLLVAALMVNVAFPPFRYPVGGRVSSRFFVRQRPGSTVPLDLQLHDAMDVAAPLGQPVLASAAGVVEALGTDAVSGNYVVVRHLLGFSTFYAHLSRIDVRKGSIVLFRSLQPIGLVGSTGYSTGPHVHFELRIGKTSIPPLTFLFLHDLRRLLIGR